MEIFEKDYSYNLITIIRNELINEIKEEEIRK
jgi:hypothetical protein